jgi:adenosylcobinamide-phosphate synthase
VRAAVMVLAGAAAFDVVVGEPPASLHPVVWMGRLQSFLRRAAPRAPGPAFAWGLVMALSGPALFGGGSWLLLRRLQGLNETIATLLAIYLLKSAFAARALGAAALAVRRPLAAGDLPGARAALRSLVSRDPAGLDPPLVAAAAIESVAENAADSIVGPLLFYVVGGVPAALAYRAINTLDAMIGYHGETEWLGKAAARLDDLANLIPARLTALLIALTAPFGGGTPGPAFATWRRDAASTESPNAGRPMAAMAGALGVRLEKMGAYRLGGGFRPATAADIDRAVRILVAVALVALALAAGGAFRVA